jgi:Ran GTPase-activating protein (RanGAP) involved in mRNA processing and transport
LRGELPEDDISTEGLCEVNLEWNEIGNHAIAEWMKFLKFDNWTRSLNLRHNRIEKEAVKEFVSMMRRNDTLISLDLRDNPGFDQESSRSIFKKLVKNIQKFK